MNKQEKIESALETIQDKWGEFVLASIDALPGDVTDVQLLEAIAIGCDNTATWLREKKK